VEIDFAPFVRRIFHENALETRFVAGWESALSSQSLWPVVVVEGVIENALGPPSWWSSLFLAHLGIFPSSQFSREIVLRDLGLEVVFPAVVRTRLHAPARPSAQQCSGHYSRLAGNPVDVPAGSLGVCKYRLPHNLDRALGLAVPLLPLG